jgi:hypothetical protein
MKLRFILLVVVFCAELTFAQTQAAAEQANSTSAATAAQESGSRSSHQQWSAQHQQEIQAIKTDLETLHTQLIQLRSGIPWMDPKDQPAMTINVKMWEVMLARMDQIVNRLATHTGMSSQTGSGGAQNSNPPPVTPRP